MKKKTIIMYILLIICVILMGVLLMQGLMNKKENKKSTITSTSNIEVNKENKIENEVVNEVKNEVVNNIEENVVNEEEKMSGEDKAISIVKKDWGEDDKVYFSIEHKNNDEEYTVCVREKSTTKTLYRYVVNINTGKFTSELEAN